MIKSSSFSSLYTKNGVTDMVCTNETKLVASISNASGSMPIERGNHKAFLSALLSQVPMKMISNTFADKFLPVMIGSALNVGDKTPRNVQGTYFKWFTFYNRANKEMEKDLKRFEQMDVDKLISFAENIAKMNINKSDLPFLDYPSKMFVSFLSADIKMQGWDSNEIDKRHSQIQEMALRHLTSVKEELHALDQEIKNEQQNMMSLFQGTITTEMMTRTSLKLIKKPKSRKV